MNGITLNAGTLFTVSGAIKFSSFGAGVATFDASGNLSSVAGTAFNTASTYSVSGAWTFSNSAIAFTGLSTETAATAIVTNTQPSGWSILIINNTTNEIAKFVQS